MATIAIGDDIQQAGAFLAQQGVFLATESIDDGKRIVAINALGLHGIGTEAGTNAGSKVVAHRLAACLSAHGILIVHNAEEDWKTTLHVVLPKSTELVHTSESHAFKDGTAG